MLSRYLYPSVQCLVLHEIPPVYITYRMLKLLFLSSGGLFLITDFSFILSHIFLILLVIMCLLDIHSESLAFCCFHFKNCSILFHQLFSNCLIFFQGLFKKFASYSIAFILRIMFSFSGTFIKYSHNKEIFLPWLFAVPGLYHPRELFSLLPQVVILSAEVVFIALLISHPELLPLST